MTLSLMTNVPAISISPSDGTEPAFSGFTTGGAQIQTVSGGGLSFGSRSLTDITLPAPGTYDLRALIEQTAAESGWPGDSIDSDFTPNMAIAVSIDPSEIELTLAPNAPTPEFTNNFDFLITLDPEVALPPVGDLEPEEPVLEFGSFEDALLGLREPVVDEPISADDFEIAPIVSLLEGAELSPIEPIDPGSVVFPSEIPLAFLYSTPVIHTEEPPEETIELDLMVADRPEFELIQLVASEQTGSEPTGGFAPTVGLVGDTSFSFDAGGLLG